MAADRLSGLPDPIIRRILSFVPSLEAVRMSLLSRRWRDMWRSVPVLYFRYINSPGLESERKKFHTFVEECLNQRRNDLLSVTDTSVTRLKLDMNCCPADFTIIDSCLAFVRLSQLKELDLCVSSSSLYSFPVAAFGLRSLSCVKLCGVALDHLTSVELPNLISLTLEKVELDDKALHNLLTGCSSLEKLRLKECKNLVNPRISNLSLKILEIVDVSRENSPVIFRVEAMNIQSFVYSGADCVPNLNLPSVEVLQNLSFSNVRFRDRWLEDLISRLPLLESLSLSNCKFGHSKIFSQHLKHFALRGNKSERVLGASIDAPNLVSFSFEGDLLLEFSMIAPNISQANIQLNHPVAYNTRWYFSLVDFLRYLDGSNSVSLGIYLEEALIFPSKFRRNCRSPLPTLKHLKVKTNLPLSRESELRDALLWASPSLETLLIEQAGL